MVTYHVTSEERQHSGIGPYTAFGILAREGDGEADRVLAQIPDVFLTRQGAEAFVEVCNRLQLDVIHLRDAVEDAVQRQFMSDPSAP